MHLVERAKDLMIQTGAEWVLWLLIALSIASLAVILERALALREAGEFDPTDLAETRYALAVSLWRSRIDRARGLELGRAARAAWADAGPDYASNVEEIDRWLTRAEADGRER